MSNPGPNQFRRARAQGRVPVPRGRWLADLDLAALEAEIVGVHRPIARDPALTVIPAHDGAAYPATVVYPLWAGN